MSGIVTPNGVLQSSVRFFNRLVHSVAWSGDIVTKGIWTAYNAIANVLELDVGHINVKEYFETHGISDPTVQDCSAAFNDAIAAASSTGNGNVFCPGGTYLITNTINMVNGVNLRGGGWGSIFFSLGPNAGTILLYTGAGILLNMSGAGGASNLQIEKCTLSHITLKGPGKTATGTVGTKVWHTRNATIRNVYVEGFEQGVWTGRNANSDINYGTMFDTVFVNSCLWGVNGDADLTDPANPIAGTSGALAFCEFLGVTVRNCGNAGIGAAFVGAFCARWIGGFIGGNNCTGIKLLGAQNCFISTHMENSGYKGTISAVTPGGSSPPVLTLTGVPHGTWAANALVIECQLGGAHGTATIRFSTDAGANWSNDITTDATPGTANALLDPGASVLVGDVGKTGLYFAFAAGTFDVNNNWTASTTEGKSYDIHVTDTTANGAGANSQGVVIMGGGCANSSTSFGRRGGIKVENCDNYRIDATQVATASGRDSSSLIGVEIASTAKGTLGPLHYEGFSGSKVKIVAPGGNNTIQDESANHLTRFRRLSALTTDEILEAILSTGDTVARFKLETSGKMSWGPGTGAADVTLERDATAELKYTGKLLQVGNYDLKGFFTLPVGSVLTIASGVVTPVQSRHPLDTEGGAGTDDLDTITAASNGSFLVLSTTNGSHDVVVKHNTGNILTKTGADRTLGLTTDRMLLICDSAKWIEL